MVNERWMLEEQTHNGCRADIQQMQNGRLRMYYGHLRMHDKCLRMYDKIVQSKTNVTVHVAFSYCNHVWHKQSGIENIELDCQ